MVALLIVNLLIYMYRYLYCSGDGQSNRCFMAPSGSIPAIRDRIGIGTSTAFVPKKLLTVLEVVNLFW